MRLIDADAFKNYIRGALDDVKHLYKDNGAWAKEITDSFCMDIDEQPTVEAEPRWTPCSERLPERADNVIICYKAGDYTLVSTGRYLYKFKMWYVDVVGDLRDGVTAWKPLPEPYKEEGDT